MYKNIFFFCWIIIKIVILLLVLQSGFINRVSGSGYAEFQNTKVLCTVIGPSPIASGQAFTEVGLVYCYFKYATFSRRDCRKGYQQDQEEKEYSVIMEDALANSICLEKYPKSRFDCHILILEDDGAALPIAITAASLAFADAGIEMFDIVTACSAAIVLNDNTNKDEVILDPSWEEQTRSKGIITFAYSSALAQVMHIHQTGYFTITQTAEVILH